ARKAGRDIEREGTKHRGDREGGAAESVSDRARAIRVPAARRARGTREARVGKRIGQRKLGHRRFLSGQQGPAARRAAQGGGRHATVNRR
ncbi:hypothetical protein, partial [Burkholderia sp. Ax-1720]|uniref:hypothetical protein n=1 Tax=Burkholderia sp. Ax-1720 TaxID=2608335 RepID=UPI0019652531